MKLSTESKRIISFGDFLTFESEPSLIVLSEGGNDYIFKLIFIENESGKSTVDFKVINDYQLEINFYNFNHPLGVGNLKPLLMGNIGNKNLYANFLITKMNDNTKTYRVGFTFYLDI